MQLTLLGTGSVQGAPVYGCSCSACQRALQDKQLRRLLCSAVLQVNGDNLLIDASHPELQTLFPAGSIDAILLTHYHMDHVQALFELRWGVGLSIPVFQPDDPQGCDDLFKHPGILDFQPPNQALQSFQLAGIDILPLPLNHSKPTFGYCFTGLLESGERGSIAYLTDTRGIPDASWEQLIAICPNYIVIDCSHPPQYSASNHNNLDDVLAMVQQLSNSQWVLTHIGHELDCYLQENAQLLPANVLVGKDNMVLSL